MEQSICRDASRMEGFPQPAKLKEALEKALKHTQDLRQILEADSYISAGVSSSRRPLEDATTQTEICPPPMPGAPSSSALTTPHTKAHGTRDQLFGTPGYVATSATPLRGGVVEAAVQQACRTLLTPQPPSVAKAVTARAGGFAPQNTLVQDSEAGTPGACHTRRVRAEERLDTPLSDLSLAPFSAYQHVQEAQEARQTAPEPQHGLADNEPQVAAGCGSDAMAVVSPPPPAATIVGRAAEPAEPCFTPNTTTVRLRAAMQWMQLQLHVSPGRIARPRRYSESSVSPARKILVPVAGHEQGAEPAQPGFCAVQAQGTAAFASNRIGLAPLAPSSRLFDLGEAEEEKQPSGGLGVQAEGAAAFKAAAPWALGAAAVVSRAEAVRQPDVHQAMVWEPSSVASAVPGAKDAANSAAAGRLSASSQTQPDTAVADGWSRALGPLRDASSRVGNTVRQLEERQGEQKAADAARRQATGAAVDAGAAAGEEAPKGRGAQQRRESGLRFFLR